MDATTTPLARGRQFISRSILLLRGRLPAANDGVHRSNRRYRLAALAGATTFAGRAISFIVAVLTVRLTANYLGAERFGVWMTITTAATLIGFADFGLSNGLINMVADAMGKGSTDEARHATSSAFWILSIVALLLLMASAVVYHFYDLSRIFNVHTSLAREESGPALAAFALCFLVQLPLGAVRGTQTGLQKLYINNIWSSIGCALSLIALILGIKLRLGMPILVFCISAPPAAVLLLNAIELFFWSHPELRPSLSYFSSKSAARALRLGLMYFILQISIAIGVQTDNLVIARILGASAVTNYAVPSRMFNIVTSLLVSLSGVLLPGYADAFARNDGHWIRRTFIRVATAGTVIALAAALFLVIFGNRLIAIWVGPQIRASIPLLFTFAILSVVYAFLQPINFLLNGVGRFKVQVLCAIVGAFANLGLSIALVSHYGIIGAVLGTLLSSVFIQAMPLTLEARFVLRSLTSGKLNGLKPAVVSE